MKIQRLIAMGAAVMLLTACSMMRDDRDNCPDCRNVLRVTLRYDYNTARANMFADHVEEATVYVTDAYTDDVITSQTIRNTSESQPLREPLFCFSFEGLDAGHYHLYATGRSEADQSFTTVVPETGDNINRLKFTVPSDDEGNVEALRLDTVWNTLNHADVILGETEPAETVIGLMRLTNDLNVMIYRSDTPTDNDHSRYDVSVTDGHDVLGCDNEPVEGEEQTLTYRPFEAWTTETSVEDSATRATVTERVAHYDLSLGRLINESNARNDARLIIRNATDGTEVVNIDLCYYLALARNAYELYNYPVQEYLDREYDYRLSFGVESRNGHDTWKYMTISINVLSWAIRIQNEEL